MSVRVTCRAPATQHWQDMLRHALRRVPTSLPRGRHVGPSVSPTLYVLHSQGGLLLPVQGTCSARPSARALDRQRATYSQHELNIVHELRSHAIIDEIDIDNRRITYAPAINCDRRVRELTPEELRRAFFLVDLIANKGYQPQHITLEKTYEVSSAKPRLDVLL